MTKQLLIYQNLVLLNNERHRDWSVKMGTDFSFAKDVTSVPLTAVEFRNAALDYPIVFAEAGDEVLPVAVMGVKADQNLYIDAEGNLDAAYIPAFLRRYPFVFSASEDGKTLSLCIDESYQGVNQQGRGERLFDADGERTQFLNSVLGFQQEYEAQFNQTKTFCAKLQELGLFESMTATLGLPEGQKFSLTGFKGISREKLMAIPGEQLEQLSKTGQLELAYCHLQSLGNFRRMAEKVSPGEAVEAVQPDEAVESEKKAARKSTKKASKKASPEAAAGS